MTKQILRRKHTMLFKKSPFGFGVSKCLPAFSIILLGACSMGVETGRPFSVADAQQIKVGVSDKSSLIKKFGQPPTRQIGTDHVETWIYAYNKSEGHSTAVAFVPFVGPFIPGAGVGSGTAQTLTITFAGDTVKTCRLNLAYSASSSSGFASTGGTTQAVEGNCNDNLQMPSH